jgi:hypothetical protein
MTGYRTLAVAALLALQVVVLGGIAGADHDHARTVGGERCVVIAQAGAEQHVVLPDSVFDHNPNAELRWKGNTARSHPLHVLVHRGRPGTDRYGDATMWVYGPESDAHCSGYVNAASSR